tara:strand:+ start:822 stop:1238 length:417 start_codon:yes stop_codon:yes gene_type:complete
MKLVPKIAVASVGVFLALQFFQPDRSAPPVSADFDGPVQVKAILQKKCYECHSNETQWPWYSYVAPLSWWIEDHVVEGRKELNFSKWGNYKSKSEKMEEIYDEVADELMPLKSYLITHPSHKVTGEELEIIEAWAFDE